MIRLLVVALSCLLGACALRPPEVRFVYDDLDSFAAAHAELQRGTPAAEAMQQYVQRASPGLRLHMSVYSVTAANLAEAVVARPEHYAAVASLRPRLRAMERDIVRGVAKLKQIVPSLTVPAVYFLVGTGRNGATPRELRRDDAHTLAVLIPVERLEQVDDVVQLTLHEVAHVAQAQTQGLPKYRGIYREPGRGTNLAFAVREGCAEYFSFLATGRLRERLVFGREHEQELWSAFAPVMNEEQRLHPGWFSGRHPQHPEWPPMVGYAVGMLMCENYHRTAADPSAALRELLAADEDHEFRRVLEAYSGKHAR